MTGELYTPDKFELASEQFAEIGHTAITGLYDPAVANQAISDAIAISRRPEQRSPGEETTTLRSPDWDTQPALHEVVGGVQLGASELGRDLSATERGAKLFLLLIEMAKDTKGPKHTDGVLADVVAVTTLRGRSRLWYEEGDVEYDMTPGITAFHDFDRKLVHQGSTDAHERVGLVVGKTVKRRLL